MPHARLADGAFSPDFWCKSRRQQDLEITIRCYRHHEGYGGTPPTPMESGDIRQLRRAPLHTNFLTLEQLGQLECRSDRREGEAGGDAHRHTHRNTRVLPNG